MIFWDLQSPGAHGRSYGIEDVRWRVCGRQSGSLNLGWPLLERCFGDQRPPNMTRDKSGEIVILYTFRKANFQGCTSQPACHSFYCVHTSSRHVSTGARPISKPCAYRGIFAELHQQGLWIRYPACQLSNFCLLAKKLLKYDPLTQNCTSKVQDKYPCWTDNSSSGKNCLAVADFCARIVWIPREFAVLRVLGRLSSSGLLDFVWFFSFWDGQFPVRPASSRSVVAKKTL